VTSSRDETTDEACYAVTGDPARVRLELVRSHITREDFDAFSFHTGDRHGSTPVSLAHCVRSFK